MDVGGRGGVEGSQGIRKKCYLSSLQMALVPLFVRV